jgi:hypothetical protein
LRDRLRGTTADHDHDHESHGTSHKPLFLELSREVTPWLVTGLVLYALVTAGLGKHALESLSAPLALGAAVACALPIALPAVPAMLIAVALWECGLRPDAALGFALIASTKTSLKPWSVAVALLVGVGVGSGNIGAALAPPPSGPFVTYASALLLGAAVVYELAARGGVRGLFVRVFHSHDSA